MKGRGAGLADCTWCSLKPLEAAGDGWTGATKKERFWKICKNRTYSVATGKVKDMRPIERKLVSSQGLGMNSAAVKIMAVRRDQCASSISITNGS